MINDILVFYDNAFLYNPNTTFLFLFVLIAALLFLFFRGLLFLARSLRLMAETVRQIHIVRSHKKYPHNKRPHIKIPLKQSILFVRYFLRVIDVMEQKVVKKVYKIVDAIAQEIFIPEHEQESK